MTLLVRTFNTRHERPFNSQQFKSEDFDHAFSRMILNMQYRMVQYVPYGTILGPNTVHRLYQNHATKKYQTM